jgi:hypothetical protein
MRSIIFALAILVVNLCVVKAQLNSFFSSEELTAKQAEAKKYLKSGADNAQDAYFSAKMLESTQQKFDCGCKTIQKLSEGEDFAGGAALYYSVKAMELCKCDIGDLNEPKNLDEMLKSNDMVEFASAALAAKTLGSASTPAKNDVIERVKSHMLANGMFKSDKNDKSSASMWKTKLALTTLAEFAQGDAALTEVSEAVAGLLSDVDNVKESDPTLLMYLQLLTGKKPSWEKTKGQSNAARLLAITEGLVSLRHSKCMRRVAAVVDSLIIIQSYKSKPLFVGLDKTTFALGGGDMKSAVVITDAFGKAVTDSGSVSVSVKKTGKDKELYSGAISGGKFDLSKAASDKDTLAPGRYTVTLSVTASDSKKPVETSVVVAVTAGMKVKSVAAGVTRAKGTSTDRLSSVKSEGSAWDEDEIASTGNFIHVAFMVAPDGKKAATRAKKPHQVFLKYTHQESGASQFFVASLDNTVDEGSSETGHKYRSSMSVGQEAETFYFASGAYDVSILVGDDSIGSGLEWNVGTVQLRFPEDPSKGKIAPLYIHSLMDASDKTLSPLPEIAHAMRPPPKNAPKIVSILFTILALVPLLAFVGWLLLVERPNVDYLFSSTFASMYALGVAVTLVLYGLYWFRAPGFDFYQTILYILGMTPVLFFIARRGVSAVIALRLKNVEKAAKKD